VRGGISWKKKLSVEEAWIFSELYIFKEKHLFGFGSFLALFLDA